MKNSILKFKKKAVLVNARSRVTIVIKILFVKRVNAIKKESISKRVIRKSASYKRFSKA